MYAGPELWFSRGQRCAMQDSLEKGGRFVLIFFNENSRYPYSITYILIGMGIVVLFSLYVRLGL